MRGPEDYNRSMRLLGGAWDVVSTVADWLAARLSRVTSGGPYLAEIDGLRFIPILLVILHHVVATYLIVVQPYGPVDLPGDWWRQGASHPLIRLVSHAGFGVQLFFVISGFVLSLPFLRAAIEVRPSPDLKRYFLRRLVRLEPPYTIALLISFGMLIGHGTPLGHLVGHLAASMFYLHGSIFGSASSILAVAWSLEVEAQFYVAMPLLAFLLFRTDQRTRRWRVVILTFVAGLASQLFFDSPAVPEAVRMSLLNQLPYFTAGFLLADLYLVEWRHERSLHPFRWDIAGIAAAAVGALLIVRPVYVPRPPWWLHEPWIGASLAFLLPWLVLVSYAAAFRGRLLRWFVTRRWVVIGGGMCYTTYLYHNLVIGKTFGPAMRIVGGRFGPSTEMVLMFVALLVPIYAATAVLFVLIEKPFMGRLSRARGR